MAKLSSANLPDWLAQWAMNRGAIEDPSASSASSSGLFDQPVIRRRRPPEGDNWNEYEPSPVLDSYPTSWADFRRDMGNIPGQLMEDISNIPESLGELLDGASNMFKESGKSVKEDTAQAKEERGLLGKINQLPDTVMRGLLGDTAVNFLDKAGKKGSTASFMRGANDETLSNSDRFGAAVGAVAPFLMPGMGAMGVGLFGGIANAMGFHHDFNPNAGEANLSFNPDAGRISWDSPEGGGHQYGGLNNENMFEANPDQYFNVEGIGYVKGTDLWDIMELVNSGDFDAKDAKFHMSRALSKYNDPTGQGYEAPFGFRDFGKVGDHNVTGQQALAQYNFDGTGAIQNEAGAIAERSNVGYNRQQTIADVIADFTNEGIDMDWDSTEASDFSGVGDDGLSFDWSDDDWTL